METFGYYQMRVTSNCELSNSNEHDVMYFEFDDSDLDWSYYEKFKLKRSNDDNCIDGR